MSRARVSSCTTVPSARPQRTPPAAEPQPLVAKTPTTAITLHPAGTLGRFPTIGIDPGAIPGTKPDARY